MDDAKEAVRISKEKSVPNRNNSKQGQSLEVVTSLAGGWSKQNKEEGKEMR